MENIGDKKNGKIVWHPRFLICSTYQQNCFYCLHSLETSGGECIVYINWKLVVESVLKILKSINNFWIIV